MVSWARSAPELTALIGAGASSPRSGAEALDQKIDEYPHLGSLMTARRHQSVQGVDFRILCVLQQGLQQSLLDGARHHVLAQPHDARSVDCQLQQHFFFKQKTAYDI